MGAGRAEMPLPVPSSGRAWNSQSPANFELDWKPFGLPPHS